MDVEKDFNAPPPSRGRSTSRPTTSRSHRSAKQRSRSPSLDLFQREKLTPYPVPDQQPLVPTINTFSRPSFELEPLAPSFLSSNSNNSNSRSSSRPTSPFRKSRSKSKSRKSHKMSSKSSSPIDTNPPPATTFQRYSTDAPKLSFSSTSSSSTSGSVRKPPKAVMAPPITYPNGSPPPYSNPWDEEVPSWDKRAKAAEIMVSQRRRRWQYAIVAGIALMLVVVAIVAPLIYVHNGKNTPSTMHNEVPGA